MIRSSSPSHRRFLPFWSCRFRRCSKTERPGNWLLSASCCTIVGSLWDETGGANRHNQDRQPSFPKPYQRELVSVQERTVRRWHDHFSSRTGSLDEVGITLAVASDCTHSSVARVWTSRKHWWKSHHCHTSVPECLFSFVSCRSMHGEGEMREGQ